MTSKLKMLGYAACLTVGPAVAAFAVGVTDNAATSTTNIPSYAATGSATPSSSGQAQMSAAERNRWAATHPRASDNGSFAGRSGISGGGGSGAGAGSR